MKKIIYAQVLTNNGATSFSGLYDENANPVTVELEKDNIGVVLTILRDGISEDEKQEVCEGFEDCDDCPFSKECEAEFKELEAENE